MGKWRERKCTQCGNTFKTKANYLSSCDKCLMEKTKSDIGIVNTPLYKAIQDECLEFCRELTSKSEKEREAYLLEYWGRLFNNMMVAELGLNWEKYSDYLQLFDFPELMRLKEDQFNALMEKTVKGGGSCS